MTEDVNRLQLALQIAHDLIEQLTAELKQVKRERDAAVRDLRIADMSCVLCRHSNLEIDCNFECSGCEPKCPCGVCMGNSQYEWRGACAENGGAEI